MFHLVCLLLWRRWHLRRGKKKEWRRIKVEWVKSKQMARRWVDNEALRLKWSRWLIQFGSSGRREKTHKWHIEIHTGYSIDSILRVQNKYRKLEDYLIKSIVYRRNGSMDVIILIELDQNWTNGQFSLYKMNWMGQEIGNQKLDQQLFNYFLNLVGVLLCKTAKSE